MTPGVTSSTRPDVAATSPRRPAHHRRALVQNRRRPGAGANDRLWVKPLRTRAREPETYVLQESAERRVTSGGACRGLQLAGLAMALAAGLVVRKDSGEQNPDPLALGGPLEQLPSNFDSVTPSAHAAELVGVADADGAGDNRADHDGASAGDRDAALDGDVDIAHARTLRSRTSRSKAQPAPNARSRIRRLGWVTCTDRRVAR